MKKFATAKEMIEKEFLPFLNNLEEVNNMENDWKFCWQEHHNQYQCVQGVEIEINFSDFFEKKQILNAYSIESVANFLKCLSNEDFFYKAILKHEKNLLKHLYCYPEVLEAYILAQSDYKNYFVKFIDVSYLNEAQQQKIIEKLFKTNTFEKLEEKSFLKHFIKEKMTNPNQYDKYFDKNHYQTMYISFNVNTLTQKSVKTKHTQNDLIKITKNILYNIQQIEKQLNISNSLLIEDANEIGLLLCSQKGVGENTIKLFIEQEVNTLLSLNYVSKKEMNKTFKNLNKVKYEILEKKSLELEMKEEKEIKKPQIRQKI